MSIKKHYGNIHEVRYLQDTFSTRHFNTTRVMELNYTCNGTELHNESHFAIWSWEKLHQRFRNGHSHRRCYHHIIRAILILLNKKSPSLDLIQLRDNNSPMDETQDLRRTLNDDDY